MTADLAALQAEYRTLRQRAANGEPWLKHRAADAWTRWFNESCRQGQPPDALETYDRNELRRFKSKIIHGLDGHAYYGPRNGMFKKNDGKQRNARTYWYETHHPITERGSVKPICGDPHCIVPEHQRFVPWSEIKALFKDSDCIGALQVAAQRLGRSPSADAYDKLGLKPSSSMIQGRFAGWNNAIVAAGLEPVVSTYVPPKKWSAEDCVVALRRVALEHGFVPTGIWWSRNRLRPSENTIVRRFGGWGKALKAAGLS